MTLQLKDWKKMSDLPALSPTSLQLLQQCSWKWYCKNILRIPEKINSGALRGSIVHLLLSRLSDKRHKGLVKKILKAKDCYSIPAVKRFLYKQIKKEKLEEIDEKGNNSYNIINDMVLVALNTDFYPKGGTVVGDEVKFEYETDNYKIRGIIDKLIEYKNGYIIRDFKGNDKRYLKEELQGNLQSLLYNLYVWRKYKKQSSIQFVFLRHPDNPIETVTPTIQELEGIEKYLVYISGEIKDFNEVKARSNLAAKQPYGKGFTGPLVCGKCSYTGQPKKDGTIAYCCPFKFNIDYFGLFNKDNKLLKTAFTERELYPKDGEYIAPLFYGGCPFFKEKI